MAVTTVENLEFHIKKTGMSSEGAQVIRDYADALKALKAAGVNKNPISSGIANSLTAIAGAMKGVDSKTISMLRQLSSALKTFDSVGGIKIDSKLAGSLNDIAAAMSDVKDEHISRLERFGNAMQHLKGISTKGYDTLPASILNIVAAVDKISDDSLLRLHKLTLALGRLRGIDLRGIGSIMTETRRASAAAAKKTSGQTNAAQQTGSGASGSRTPWNWKEAIEGAKQFSNKVKKVVDTVVKYLKKILTVLGQIGKKFATAFGKATGISSITKAVSSLATVFKSLGRIAFYRVIRSAIKAVTEAFQEGAENAYWFSREFGQATKYISDAYDTLTSASFKMKNQLGAAWSSLIAAIKPVLLQLINMVTKAAEVFTQFFAILGGSNTYLKAIDYNKQWADSADKAGKAAKEWKNQLMGFDEINKLNDSDNAGSGNNNDALDYGNMFEEVPVGKNFMSDLLNTIKNGQWAEAGKMLADKLNELINSVDWHDLGVKIGEKINNVIQFAYNFLKNFDFKKAGQSLAEMLMGMIDSIDFETLGRLFVRKITALLDFVIGFIMTPGLWEKLAKAVGDLFHGALSEAAEWLSENNLADVLRTLGNGILGVLKRVAEEIKEHKDVFVQIGKQIGDALAAVPWLEILQTLADILWTVFKSLVIDGLLSTSGGKIFLALLAGIKGLQLAFTLATPVVAAGVKVLAEGIAAKLLGIPAAATATATATGTAVKGIGTTMAAGAAIVGKAALAVTDAVLVAYDVKALNNAAKTYNDAQDAHAKEAYTALNSYAKLYNEKGKEVADAWAKMVYDVDTTGEDFFGAQKTLTNKISDLWEDTPENMAQGFGQGIKYYFGGGGGGGLIGLLNDAGNGIANAFKNVLGIHSPSTVFADMGKNLVEGFKNGIQGAWSNLSSIVNGLVNNLVQSIGSAISSAVSSAMQKVSNLVSSARSTLSSITSSISSSVSGAINTAKSIASTAVNAVSSAIGIKKYAAGGFPEDGLFYANHGEIVGQFSNGRTAVANNEQITDGIAEAVYEAFMSAMTNSGGPERDVNLYLDGELIARSTTKYQRQFARAAG